MIKQKFTNCFELLLTLAIAVGFVYTVYYVTTNIIK
jgi:hypothetical protein